LLALGCAFQDVPIQLPKVLGTGLRGGDGRLLVVAIPFADERSDSRLCGTQKNNMNIRTARANCSEEPAPWIAALLAQELRSAGFRVLSDSDPRPPSAVRIKGSLLQLFVEVAFGGFTTVFMEADLHAQLVLRSHSGLHAERSFYIKGTNSKSGFHGVYQRAVDESVDLTLREMIAAILSLMNRFPELGVEEAASVSSAGSSITYDSAVEANPPAVASQTEEELLTDWRSDHQSEWRRDIDSDFCRHQLGADRHLCVRHVVLPPEEAGRYHDSDWNMISAPRDHTRGVRGE
jgi:hypothetical protein